jgi:hypothetical protein
MYNEGEAEEVFLVGESMLVLHGLVVAATMTEGKKGNFGITSGSFRVGRP